MDASRSQWIRTLCATAAALALAACAAQDLTDDDGLVGGTVTEPSPTEEPIEDLAGIPSFEEFAAGVYKEPFEGGVYIVNGDTPIDGDKKLREFYRAVYTSNLIVHQDGGVDARWNDSQKLDLTYCVSDAFGSRKAQLLDALASATNDGWELGANVNFVHVASEDANCTANNPNVVFDVRPTTGAPYLARAFFPGQARGSRNVIVDTSSFSSGWPLDSVIAHELGHVLGFRHEHTRPESGHCYEDNRWRPLTPYDSKSIMHYPQCGGGSNSLEFASSDLDGAAEVYGTPGASNGGTDSGGGIARSGTDEGELAEGDTIDYQPLAVVPGSRVKVQLRGSGDADLYVRFDSAPTLGSFDCRPYFDGSNESCSLDVPAGVSEVYVALHAYRASSYHLDAEWVEPE